MKTKLIALLAVPFLTSGLVRAEDKPAAPAAPATPAAPAHPGKEGKKGEPKVTPEEAFKKADANSDSSLSLDEFKALPRFKKDNSKAEEIFKKKDTNSDSKLSLEEFTAKPAKESGKGKGVKAAEPKAPAAPGAPAPEVKKP
jgi:hypothetical protein